MEHNGENMAWAVDKIAALSAAFGKKFERDELLKLLARQLLDIVQDNEEIPAEGHEHSRPAIGKAIRRGDWLIDTLAKEQRRWPVPFVWRKTWSKYWAPADGKDWQEMAGAQE